jgi:hypothetical protein
VLKIKVSFSCLSYQILEVGPFDLNGFSVLLKRN